jgi:hypothetical protein
MWERMRWNRGRKGKKGPSKEMLPQLGVRKEYNRNEGGLNVKKERKKEKEGKKEREKERSKFIRNNTNTETHIR